MTDPVKQVITDLFSGRDDRFIKVGEQWLGAFPDGLVIIKKVPCPHLEAPPSLESGSSLVDD